MTRSATVTGQATLGVEIAEQLPDVDTVVVAVGGGGLCAGVTRGARRGAAGGVGRRRGARTRARRCTSPSSTVACGRAGRWRRGDALGASRLGEIAFATVQEHPTRSLLVTDEAIIEARRWLWRAARVAAEPGGAAAVAALLSGRYVPRDGERVCVIVCGGNADPADLS